MKQVLSLLSDYKKRDSYAAYLLKRGYPVTFSNHVDPFATSNDRYSLNLIELFLLKGIPFSLQTKGGRLVDEAIALIGTKNPMVWYISIATLDEAIAKKVEPGAPPIRDRLKMVEKIIGMGHQVCVGINPAVDAWLPNPKELTDELAALGVWGAWVQSMHLSVNQMEAMPKKSQDAMGKTVIHQAMYPSKHPETHKHYLVTQEAAQESGLHTYDNQQAGPSRYFEKYKELYPVRFPLYQDFVNYCHETKVDGQLIYWEEYRDFFLPRLPIEWGSRGLRSHINARTLPQTLYGKYIPTHMTYEELLKFAWQIKQIAYCPVNIECFGWASDWEEQEDGTEGWTQYLDDNELPILIFKPEGTNREAYVQY